MLSSFPLAEKELPYLLHRLLAYQAPAVRASSAPGPPPTRTTTRGRGHPHRRW